MRTRLWRYSIACLCAFAALGCGSDAHAKLAAIDAISGGPSAPDSGGVSPAGTNDPLNAAGAKSSALGSSKGAGVGGGVTLAGAGSQPVAGQSAADAGQSADGAAGQPSAGAAGQPQRAGRAGQPAAAGGTSSLFFLNATGAQLLSANSDGSARKVIVQGKGVGPDGVAVDVSAGHAYWTNMGVPSADDGTILRADLDGGHVTTIVAAGGTFTPKQLKLDAQHGKLYWSDREGMRVMRANLDGSMIETLFSSGSGETDRADASKWCVGIALDLSGGKFYWSQKGGDNARQGTIKRANLELPAGQTAANRSDIEVLFKNLPEPIDLELELDKRLLYWTDRGDNTVSRAPLEPAPGFDPAARTDRQILVRGIAEAIGIALDLRRGRLFYTSLAGVVASAGLDGSDAHNVLTGQGALTGIALVELPD